MLKKKISLILALVLAAGAFGACSAGSQSPEEQSETVAAGESVNSSENEKVSESASAAESSENSESSLSASSSASVSGSSSNPQSPAASQVSGSSSSASNRNTAGSNTKPGNSGSTSTQVQNNGGNSQINNNQQANSGGNSSSKKNNNGGNNNQSGNNNSGNNQQKVNNDSVGDIDLYNALFNVANNLKIELTVSQEEMDKLQSDYNRYKRINSKSPIYRKASLVITINGQRFAMDEVGIRLKGNMWLSPVYDKHGNLNISHYKLSFNETFDKSEYYGNEAKVWASKEERKARKNRRFATLKKLDLKWNSCYDETYMREIYAAKMFRENGVLVQNINLAQTVFNGNNYGVMKLYEPVDEIFLEKNLPSSALGGDLYKCGWTNKPCNYVLNQVTYGVDDKDTGAKYNYNLKTNEKSSDHGALRNLLSTLASNPDKNTFESVIDTYYLANFLAASYFAGDPDDIRNNYNNHYVYFRNDNGKAIFIPYDNDRTMGITYGYNPDGTGMTKPSPYSNMASGIRKTQANPMINLAIVNSNGYIRNEYTSALKRIASSGILSDDVFNSYYNLAFSNYSGVVTPSVSFANQELNFRFSLDGRYTSSDRENMSFSEYAQRILKTFNAEVK